MASLYRVRGSAVVHPGGYNHSLVTEHGWLWVHVEGLKFRSIATGGHGEWVFGELEEVNEDANL